MAPNELLNRMLNFAESITDQLQKAKLINGAYNTWYLNTSKQNPYSYNDIKKEKVYYDGTTPIYYYKENTAIIKKLNTATKRKLKQ
jgi:hypothetical protein